MDKVWTHHAKYYDLFQNNLDRYREIIELHLTELNKYGKILDTGSGTGNLTLELLKQGHKVVAIDTDETSLNVLKKKCFEYIEMLRVERMDVQELRFEDGMFDGVSSMFVIPFVKDNLKYFSEVYRVLKDGGKFSVSAWAPEKDSLKGIINFQREELEKKRILPKYQKEWDHIMKSVDITLEMVLAGSRLEELKVILNKIGFKNIKVYSENPYGKYVYFLTCNK